MKSKTKLNSKTNLNSKAKLKPKANLKPSLKDAKEQTLLRVSIFLILFGNLLGISLGLWQSRHPDIVTDLKRSEYNESIHEESLKFQTDDGKTHHITLKVPSKTYSKEESQTLLDEASKKLDSSILGKIRVFLPFIHRFLFPNLFLIVLFSFFGQPLTLKYSTIPVLSEKMSLLRVLPLRFAVSFRLKKRRFHGRKSFMFILKN